MGRGSTKFSGQAGEDIARRYLEDLGYQILARNYRSGKKEIDLVALDQKELVFIEVKAGKSKEYGEPELRVDNRKRKNLAEVAQAFLAETKIQYETCRFDVVGVDLLTDKVTHYKRAFVLSAED